MKKHIVNQLMDVTIDTNTEPDRIIVDGHIYPALIASILLIGLFTCWMLSRL